MAADLLVVYGTLRLGRANAEAALLASRAEFVGMACLGGRLVDLGDFPGLRAGDGVVEGDLFRITDASLFDALDEYEGDAFDRVRRDVELPDGSRRLAWVYVLR